MNQTAERIVHTFDAGTIQRRADLLVQQFSFRLHVDGIQVCTATCSPGEIATLCTGFLVTEGYLMPGQLPLAIEQEGSEARAALPPGSARASIRPVESELVVPLQTVLDLCSAASCAAGIHAATGGTHSAAIGIDGRMAFHAEDISRSAALERVVGKAHIAGVRLSEAVLLLSSRVPAGFVAKASHARIPVIAAVSAPTAQAVDLAESLGICLCGFVRGSRANVYSCPWRVGL